MKWILIYYVASVAIAADVDVFTKVDIESETLGSRLNGWTRVANIDFSEYETNCPSPWVLNYVRGKNPYCRAPSTNSGCSTVTYNVAMSYNKVLGLVNGYQKGTPDGFRASRDDNAGINDPYVDGVSITLSKTLDKPRRHVWTYAAGLTSDGNFPNNNCPCTVTPGPNPPSFVGEDYYCSSGSPNFPSHDHIYVDVSLWNGTECTHNRNNCCANVGLPWFYREFPTQQHDNIEVRICYNQGYSDEAIFITKLKLYVQ